MQATKENIGQILYPVDNSYAIAHDDEKAVNPYLAGVHGTESKPCKIVSEPYEDNLLGRSSSAKNLSLKEGNL